MEPRAGIEPGFAESRLKYGTQLHRIRSLQINKTKKVNGR